MIFLTLACKNDNELTLENHLKKINKLNNSVDTVGWVVKHHITTSTQEYYVLEKQKNDTNYYFSFRFTRCCFVLFSLFII